jgi:hypothetical protein
VAPLSALFRVFEQAQVHLRMPPAPLAAEVIARPRRRGNTRLRRILVGSVDPAEVRSVLELRFLRMCAAHGIARPQVNVRIGDWTPLTSSGRTGAWWPRPTATTSTVRQPRVAATPARTRPCVALTEL